MGRETGKLGRPSRPKAMISDKPAKPSKGMRPSKPSKKPKARVQLLKAKDGKMVKDTFKPHMMYDKKTGKAVKAPTMAKHLELKKKGYGHTKPKNNKK